MKILFVTRFFPPDRSAGAVRVGNFAKFSANLGNDVTVLAILASGTGRERARALLTLLIRPKKHEVWEGVKVLRVPAFFRVLRSISIDLFQLASFFVVSLMLCLSERPDFVVASLPSGELGLAAFFASKLLGRRIAFDIRDDFENEIIMRARKPLKRWTWIGFRRVFDAVYSRAEVVFAVTSTLARRLQARGIGRVQVLPNGADTRMFRLNKKKARGKWGLKRTDFVLVFAGYLSSAYRIDVALDALRLLVEEIDRIKLLVVGTGPQLAYLTRKTKELGLAHHVVFLGERPHSEVAEILRNMDVGIVPLRSGTHWRVICPVKFYECCASGLPVIVSAEKGGDVFELTKSSGVGIAVPPLDARAFATAVKKLYLDTSLRTQMGKAARELIIDRFDREKLTYRLISTLSREVGGCA